MDFHTGGADRFNAAQIRIIKGEKNLTELAKIFGAPFVLYSKNLNKSFRNTCYKLGVPVLLFEGGKSFNIDNNITNTGVNGAKRVLDHLEMLNSKFKVSQPKKSCVFIAESNILQILTVVLTTLLKHQMKAIFLTSMNPLSFIKVMLFFICLQL